MKSFMFFVFIYRFIPYRRTSKRVCGKGLRETCYPPSFYFSMPWERVLSFALALQYLKVTISFPKHTQVTIDKIHNFKLCLFMYISGPVQTSNFSFIKYMKRSTFESIKFDPSNWSTWENRLWSDFDSNVELLTCLIKRMHLYNLFLRPKIPFFHESTVHRDL